MGALYESMLDRIAGIVDDGLDADGTNAVLEVLGATPMDVGVLAELMLYNETLPKAQEFPYTEHQRFLHFLWDVFDKLPICLAVTFAIPFRRLLAERMLKSCGRGVIIEENVRFNFPQCIELGDGIFFNRNVFLDSKGGIAIGDFVGVAENVQIFSHGHSEADHLERTYDKVVIGDYVKVYSGVTILPGVTIGDAAIVASGSMVTKSIPAGKVAAGVPAKVIRDRVTKGHEEEELGHIWLF